MLAGESEFSTSPEMPSLRQSTGLMLVYYMCVLAGKSQFSTSGSLARGDPSQNLAHAAWMDEQDKLLRNMVHAAMHKQ